MVDLGFSKQLEEIFEHLGTGQKRQTIMASATLTPAVKVFTDKYLDKNFLTIDVDGGRQDTEEEHFVTPKQLAQHHMVVTMKLRLAALAVFLKQRAEQNEKVLVFFSTCDSVDFHAALLQAVDGFNADPRAVNTEGNAEYKSKIDKERSPSAGMFGADFPVLKLHGNIDQGTRTRTYARFCRATTGALLCTDVAARGLDLPAVDWILQYDPPTDLADYVHRVGRTARRGARGRACFFLLPSEAGYLRELGRRGVETAPLSLQALLARMASARQRKRPHPEDLVALDVQAALEATVENSNSKASKKENSDGDLVLLGRSAFQAYIRAYATHKADMKHIFNVRLLHLGHVAKSFALKDCPKAIKVSGKMIKNGRKTGLAPNKKKKKRVVGKIAQKYKSDAIMRSEFA